MDREFYFGARPLREIRAVYDEHTIRVYQAFGVKIAEPALMANTFVPPFRFDGITSWIKPSFLWCMRRTDWGQCTKDERKKTRPRPDEGKTVVLGVDVARAFFDSLLTQAFVNNFEDCPSVDKVRWVNQARESKVVVQWDPEKDLQGFRRGFKAIQIGIRCPKLEEYTRNIRHIENIAPVIESMLLARTEEEKISLVPDERPYPVGDHIIKGLRMDYV